MKRTTFFWWLRMFAVVSSVFVFIWRLSDDSLLAAIGANTFVALLVWVEATFQNRRHEKDKAE